MWKRRAYAVAIVLVLLVPVVYAVNFNQPITDTLGAIVAQPADHFQSLTDTLSGIVAQPGDAFKALADTAAKIVAGNSCPALLGDSLGTIGVGTIVNGTYVAGTFTSSACSLLVVVAPCNWFQLQCWWYPFFFFSTYACFLIPIAKVGEIDRRDFGWIFLDGFTISSLIATIMGMISIMVPMVLAAGAVLWVIRSR